MSIRRLVLAVVIVLALLVGLSCATVRSLLDRALECCQQQLRGEPFDPTQLECQLARCELAPPGTLEPGGRTGHQLAPDRAPPHVPAGEGPRGP